MSKPAIVLSAHTMGLGVIRALGVMDVPVIAMSYDREDMGCVSSYVKEVIHVPHPERFPNEFIDALMSSSSRFSGGLLIPASDETLTTVSRHKDLLEQGYTVACTDWEITKQFINKRYTYALAERLGIPVPRTLVPRSLADVERFSQTIQYPCLVKPAQSHQYYAVFKRKMVKAHTFDQLATACRQAFEAGLEIMLQEFIPGDDEQGVNYNSYFWDGIPRVEFTARHIRNAPPELGSPRVVLSEAIPEVIASGRELLKAMGFYGYSCIEFKRDTRDGVYKLMEVNGRHNRSLLLAVRCGINFPWLQYRHLIEGEMPSERPYETGVYWIDITRDIAYSATYLKEEHYAPVRYLRPYISPHIFAIFDLKDPKPFIKRCGDIVKKALQSMLRPAHAQRASVSKE